MKNKLENWLPENEEGRDEVGLWRHEKPIKFAIGERCVEEKTIFCPKLVVSTFLHFVKKKQNTCLELSLKLC